MLFSITNDVFHQFNVFMTNISQNNEFMKTLCSEIYSSDIKTVIELRDELYTIMSHHQIYVEFKLNVYVADDVINHSSQSSVKVQINFNFSRKPFYQNPFGLLRATQLCLSFSRFIIRNKKQFLYRFCIKSLYWCVRVDLGYTEGQTELLKSSNICP